MSNSPTKRGPGRPRGSRNRPKNLSTPNQRQQQKDQTRERIVAAAILTVAEVGPNHATLEEIARQAQTSLGGVEHHFTTKADLFAAAAEVAKVRLTEIEASTMGIEQLIWTILSDVHLCAAWWLSPSSRRADFAPLFAATIENGAVVSPKEKATGVALDLTLLQGLMSSEFEEISPASSSDLIRLYARTRGMLIEHEDEGRNERRPLPALSP